MTRVPLADPTLDPFNGILAHLPDVASAWSSLERAFMSPDGLLPMELKEEARSEMAQLVGCVFCATVGAPPSQERPSPRQALASAFALQLANDYREIDDAMFEALREEFTNAEIVELVSWLCFKFGANMLGALWKLPPANDDQRRMYDDVLAAASVQ